MGLMADPTSGAQLVLTPHPITCEGQQTFAAPLVKGETLGQFLRREVPDWTGDAWEVCINGVVVPHEVMERVRPKETALIEVRGMVKKQALYLVAFAALTWWTMGAFAAAGAAGGTVFGLSGMAAYAATAAVYVGGSMLINKALGPKPPSAGSSQAADPVYSINSARNAPRPYEPLPILFGSTQITPDVASMPYVSYEGNNQFMGMVLTPGLNVHSIETIYNGDTPLASFEGVETFLSGLPGHPEQIIPLFSNADSIAGGELETGGWVQRTSSADALKLQLDFEGLLYDVDSKGKFNKNDVTFQIQYRKVGTEGWTTAAPLNISNRDSNTVRRTVTLNVERGQYDVRVQMGQSYWHDGTPHDECRFTWTTLKTIQPDEADYTGISRIGIRIKATGQLNGALDEVRMVAHSAPIPVWNGTAWVTQHTSNPGAQLLAYARGIRDANGRLIAGIGLSDSQIDIPALQAFMVHCAENGYAYDAYIKDDRNRQEMVEAIALAGLGQTSWASGKFSVVWASSSQPLTGVVNMATMKRGSFQVDYTLKSGADGVEYTYVDPATWSPVTLRVPAPGVTTMQNPARITGEGITDEAHAARLARYHLAQHLFQSKDITYGASLEHLTYRRMSVLALSHDMTQWGFGGRLVGASRTGGVVTVQLGEAVPFLASRYVGLRVPGELGYRVFPVASFTGESDTLTLVGAWPEDVPFPGDSDDNPAHDTLWIYDIKATPGYRVRVVQIDPESDMEGARVTVVPEGPEFWTYVHTGQYIPPANQSLLQGRPVASDLIVTEQRVVQGDTVFTELGVAFTVTGKMDYAVVTLSEWLGDSWSDPEQVAETRTTSARFRIPRAGAYTITVRPYGEDGVVGVAASAQYGTTGVEIPPPAFDLFNVLAVPGGLRKYSWAYLSDTIQAPDFAGAEIRYIAGTVASPDWDTMTPVGDEGYHPAAFESTVPPAGTWTFAARARNTSGQLSAMTVITRTLSDNLGEVIEGIGDQLDEAEQAQIAIQAAIDAEEAARIAAILDATIAAGADATAKANAALASAMAAVDALASEVAEIAGAPDWEPTVAYAAGFLVKYSGALYRARVATTGHQPNTSPTQWEKIGDYASLGQAVAAALAQSSQNASDIEAEVTRINALYARMPTGSGSLATEASVASQASALATQISAEATRVDALLARMPAGDGVLATSARVGAVESASVSRDDVLASRATVVESRLGGSLMLFNGSFESAGDGWATTESNATASIQGLPAGYSIITGADAVSGGLSALQITSGAAGRLLWNFQRAAVAPGEKVFVRLRGRVATLGGSAPGDGTRVRVLVRFYDASGSDAGLMLVANVEAGIATLNAWQDYIGTIVAPAGAATARIGLQSQNAQSSGQFNIDSIEMEREGATGGAIASVVDNHSTRITSAEGAITAQGAAITAAQSAIVGKADASAVSALDTRVTATEGGVTTNASAITSVRATMGGGGNLLPNSDFAAGTTGWTVSTGGGAPGGVPAIFPHTTSPAPSYIPQDRGGLFLRNNGAGAALPSGVYMDANSTGSNLSVSVEAGKRYMGSIYLGAHRCSGQIFLQWVDATGGHISYVNGTITTASGVGGNLANFGRVRAVGVAPSNAAFLRLKVRAVGSGAAGTDSYLFATSPMIEECVSATQDTPSPYSVGAAGTASVTQQALVTANSANGKINAVHTVALDVNGYVSGTVNQNTGTTSSFGVRADAFSIQPSSPTGERLHWSNGNLRIYDSAGTLRVQIGTGF